MSKKLIAFLLSIQMCFFCVTPLPSSYAYERPPVVYDPTQQQVAEKDAGSNDGTTNPPPPEIPPDSLNQTGPLSPATPEELSPEAQAFVDQVRERLGNNYAFEHHYDSRTDEYVITVRYLSKAEQGKFVSMLFTVKPDGKFGQVKETIYSGMTNVDGDLIFKGMGGNEQGGNEQGGISAEVALTRLTQLKVDSVGADRTIHYALQDKKYKVYQDEQNNIVLEQSEESYAFSGEIIQQPYEPNLTYSQAERDITQNEWSAAWNGFAGSLVNFLSNTAQIVYDVLTSLRYYAVEWWNAFKTKIAWIETDYTSGGQGHASHRSGTLGGIYQTYGVVTFDGGSFKGDHTFALSRKDALRLSLHEGYHLLGGVADGLYGMNSTDLGSAFGDTSDRYMSDQYTYTEWRTLNTLNYIKGRAGWYEIFGNNEFQFLPAYGQSRLSDYAYKTYTLSGSLSSREYYHFGDIPFDEMRFWLGGGRAFDTYWFDGGYGNKYINDLPVYSKVRGVPLFQETYNPGRQVTVNGTPLFSHSVEEIAKIRALIQNPLIVAQTVSSTPFNYWRTDHYVSGHVVTLSSGGVYSNYFISDIINPGTSSEMISINEAGGWYDFYNNNPNRLWDVGSLVQELILKSNTMTSLMNQTFSSLSSQINISGTSFSNVVLRVNGVTVSPPSDPDMLLTFTTILKILWNGKQLLSASYNFVSFTTQEMQRADFIGLHAYAMNAEMNNTSNYESMNQADLLELQGQLTTEIQQLNADIAWLTNAKTNKTLQIATYSLQNAVALKSSLGSGFSVSIQHDAGTGLPYIRILNNSTPSSGGFVSAEFYVNADGTMGAFRNVVYQDIASVDGNLLYQGLLLAGVNPVDFMIGNVQILSAAAGEIHLVILDIQEYYRISGVAGGTVTLTPELPPATQALVTQLDSALAPEFAVTYEREDMMYGYYAVRIKNTGTIDPGELDELAVEVSPSGGINLLWSRYGGSAGDTDMGLLFEALHQMPALGNSDVQALANMAALIVTSIDNPGTTNEMIHFTLNTENYRAYKEGVNPKLAKEIAVSAEILIKAKQILGESVVRGVVLAAILPFPVEGAAAVSHFYNAAEDFMGSYTFNPSLGPNDRPAWRDASGKIVSEIAVEVQAFVDQIRADLPSGLGVHARLIPGSLPPRYQITIDRSICTEGPGLISCTMTPGEPGKLGSMSFNVSQSLEVSNLTAFYAGASWEVGVPLWDVLPLIHKTANVAPILQDVVDMTKIHITESWGSPEETYAWITFELNGKTYDINLYHLPQWSWSRLELFGVEDANEIGSRLRDSLDPDYRVQEMIEIPQYVLGQRAPYTDFGSWFEAVYDSSDPISVGQLERMELWVGPEGELDWFNVTYHGADPRPYPGQEVDPRLLFSALHQPPIATNDLEALVVMSRLTEVSVEADNTIHFKLSAAEWGVVMPDGSMAYTREIPKTDMIQNVNNSTLSTAYKAAAILAINQIPGSPHFYTTEIWFNHVRQASYHLCTPIELNFTTMRSDHLSFPTDALPIPGIIEVYDSNNPRNLLERAKKFMTVDSSFILYVKSVENTGSGAPLSLVKTYTLNEAPYAEIYFDQSEQLIKTVYFQYNWNLLPRLRIEAPSGTLLFPATVKSYDANGNLYLELVYSSSIQITNMTVYGSASPSQIPATTVFYAPGNPNPIASFRYNAQGDLLNSTIYSLMPPDWVLFQNLPQNQKDYITNGMHDLAAIANRYLGSDPEMQFMKTIFSDSYWQWTFFLKPDFTSGSGEGGSGMGHVGGIGMDQGSLAWAMETGGYARDTFLKTIVHEYIHHYHIAYMNGGYPGIQEENVTRVETAKFYGVNGGTSKSLFVYDNSTGLYTKYTLVNYETDVASLKALLAQNHLNKCVYSVDVPLNESGQVLIDEDTGRVRLFVEPPYMPMPDRFVTEAVINNLREILPSQSSWPALYAAVQNTITYLERIRLTAADFLRDYAGLPYLVYFSSEDAVLDRFGTNVSGYTITLKKPDQTPVSIFVDLSGQWIYDYSTSQWYQLQGTVWVPGVQNANNQTNDSQESNNEEETSFVEITPVNHPVYGAVNLYVIKTLINGQLKETLRYLAVTTNNTTRELASVSTQYDAAGNKVSQTYTTGNSPDPVVTVTVPVSGTSTTIEVTTYVNGQPQQQVYDFATSDVRLGLDTFGIMNDIYARNARDYVRLYFAGGKLIFFSVQITPVSHPVYGAVDLYVIKTLINGQLKETLRYLAVTNNNTTRELASRSIQYDAQGSEISRTYTTGNSLDPVVRVTVASGTATKIAVVTYANGQPQQQVYEFTASQVQLGFGAYGMMQTVHAENAQLALDAHVAESGIIIITILYYQYDASNRLSQVISKDAADVTLWTQQYYYTGTNTTPDYSARTYADGHVEYYNFEGNLFLARRIGTTAAISETAFNDLKDRYSFGDWDNDGNFEGASEDYNGFLNATFDVANQYAFLDAVITRALQAGPASEVLGVLSNVRHIVFIDMPEGVGGGGNPDERVLLLNNWDVEEWVSGTDPAERSLLIDVAVMDMMHEVGHAMDFYANCPADWRNNFTCAMESERTQYAGSAIWVGRLGLPQSWINWSLFISDHVRDPDNLGHPYSNPIVVMFQNVVGGGKIAMAPLLSAEYYLGTLSITNAEYQSSSVGTSPASLNGSILRGYNFVFNVGGTTRNIFVDFSGEWIYDGSSWIANPDPQSVTRQLLNRDEIEEEDFNAIVTGYHYVHSGFFDTSLNYDNFLAYTPTAEQIDVLRNALTIGMSTDAARFAKLLAGVQHVLFLPSSSCTLELCTSSHVSLESGSIVTPVVPSLIPAGPDRGIAFSDRDIAFWGLFTHEAKHLRDMFDGTFLPPTNVPNRARNEWSAYSEDMYFRSSYIRQNYLPFYNEQKFLLDNVPFGNFTNDFATYIADQNDEVLYEQLMLPLNASEEVLAAQTTFPANTFEYISSATGQRDRFGTMMQGFDFVFRHGTTDYSIFSDLSGEWIYYHGTWYSRDVTGLIDQLRTTFPGFTVAPAAYIPGSQPPRYRITVTGQGAGPGTFTELNFVVASDATPDFSTLAVTYQSITGLDAELLFEALKLPPISKPTDLLTFVAMTELMVIGVDDDGTHFKLDSLYYKAYRDHDAAHLEQEPSPEVKAYASQLQALLGGGYDIAVTYFADRIGFPYEVNVVRHELPTTMGAFQELFFNLSWDGQLNVTSIRAAYVGKTGYIQVAANTLFEALKMPPISKSTDLLGFVGMTQLMVVDVGEGETTYFGLGSLYYRAYRDKKVVYLEQETSPEVKTYVIQLQTAIGIGSVVTATYLGGSNPPAYRIIVAGKDPSPGLLSQLSFNVASDATPDLSTLAVTYNNITGVDAELLFDGIMDIFKLWSNDTQVLVRMSQIKVLGVDLDGTIHFKWNESGYVASPDIELTSLIQTYLLDSILDRADMLSIFKAVEDEDFVSAVEFSILQSMQNNPIIYKQLDYVHSLADDVILGTRANATYQGMPLGNLARGSSATQLRLLVNKWFLGMDNPISEYGIYRLAVGSLFVDGLDYEDIRQGASNDCYFMASLAEIALRAPAIITDMFIDNGDGTFTVKFFLNSWYSGVEGVADYVTVDRQLPVEPVYGYFLYANSGALFNDPNAELWTALAEKAYVEINSKWGIRSSSENNYSAIDWGHISDALSEITGNTLTRYQPLDFDSVVSSWASGAIMGFTSLMSPADSPAVIASHAYALVDYNDMTQMFTLFNPWGISLGLLTFTWNQVQRNFSYYDTAAGGIVGLASSIFVSQDTNQAAADPRPAAPKQKPHLKFSYFEKENSNITDQSKTAISGQDSIQDVLGKWTDQGRQKDSGSLTKRTKNTRNKSLQRFRLKNRFPQINDITLEPLSNETLSYKNVLARYLLERAITLYLTDG